MLSSNDDAGQAASLVAVWSWGRRSGHGFPTAVDDFARDQFRSIGDVLQLPYASGCGFWGDICVPDARGGVEFV